MFIDGVRCAAKYLREWWIERDVIRGWYEETGEDFLAIMCALIYKIYKNYVL